MKLIYISGPYTSGGAEENVARAVKLANDVAQLGYAPYVPHLMHYWDKSFPHEYSFWMRICLAVVRNCDAVLRFPGYSPGADAECELAASEGIPVFTNIEALDEWLKN